MKTLADFLETEESGTLLGMFREQTLPAGTMLPPEGPDQIMIVRSGRMRVYLATEERELSLTYLEPGDVFSTHTRAALAAYTDARVLLAPRRIIERQLGSYPPLQAAMFRVLAMTLSQSMTLIEDLAFHQVRGRIARYLIRSLRRQGSELSPGALIRLEMGMEEIAALLGTTRQTASTELNAMVREGAIARQGRRRIAVVHPERLRDWAGEGDVAA